MEQVINAFNIQTGAYVHMYGDPDVLVLILEARNHEGKFMKARRTCDDVEEYVRQINTSMAKCYSLDLLVM